MCIKIQSGINDTNGEIKKTCEMASDKIYFLASNSHLSFGENKSYITNTKHEKNVQM